MVHTIQTVVGPIYLVTHGPPPYVKTTRPHETSRQRRDRRREGRARDAQYDRRHPPAPSRETLGWRDRQPRVKVVGIPLDDDSPAGLNEFWKKCAIAGVLPVKLSPHPDSCDYWLRRIQAFRDRRSLEERRQFPRKFVRVTLVYLNQTLEDCMWDEMCRVRLGEAEVEAWRRISEGHGERVPVSRRVAGAYAREMR